MYSYSYSYSYSYESLLLIRPKRVGNTQVDIDVVGGVATHACVDVHNY